MLLVSCIDSNECVLHCEAAALRSSFRVGMCCPLPAIMPSSRRTGPIRLSVRLTSYRPAWNYHPGCYSHANDELSLQARIKQSACLCVPPLPVKIHLSPARPLAFPFDSSFYSCLSSFMFLSVLCTCQVEYPCIINDSAVLSLLLHPSVPRSQAAVRSTGLASRLVSSQQRGGGSGAQPERLPC